jgi:hypothetical protein
MPSIEPKEILRLAKGVCENDIVIIGEAVYVLQITREQVQRTPTRKEYSKSKPLEVQHLKKMDLLRRSLRIEIGKIAAEKELIAVGEPIPTQEVYLLRSIAADGTFLADSKKTKLVEFVDPLNESFIERVQSVL